MSKMHNDVLTPELLEARKEYAIRGGFDVPKYLQFCDVLIKEGYTITIYEARKTFSKYITVKKQGYQPYKVRFSNHKPIKHLEMRGSCDFFVGITNIRTTNWLQALEAVRQHFKTGTIQ